MNDVYLHIMLSHVPVIGIIFCIIMLITASIIKSRELKVIAIGCFIIIASAAMLVYTTGGPAGEAAERFAWAPEAMIEQHEELAEATVTLTGILGAAAVAGMFLIARSKKAAPWFYYGFICLVIVNAAMIARTANLGGQIRHAEIRAISYSSAQQGELNSKGRAPADEAGDSGKHDDGHGD